MNRQLVDAPLFERLRQLAELVSGKALTDGAARWLKRAHGDYALIADDNVERVTAPHVELTLDFSEVTTDQAEVVYSDGNESFVVPQWPRSLALVERTATLYRYERYLNQLVGDGEVFRLRLLLMMTP
jgi:hypothetical protein